MLRVHTHYRAVRALSVCVCPSEGGARALSLCVCVCPSEGGARALCVCVCVCRSAALPFTSKTRHSPAADGLRRRTCVGRIWALPALGGSQSGRAADASRRTCRKGEGGGGVKEVV